MSDADTTIAELKERMARFVSERNWERYHTPKNLAVSLVLEAAEVLEHFQWRTDQEVEVYLRDPAALRALGEEIADVFSYVLSLSNVLGIDLTTAFLEKLRKNETRYPISEWKGRAH